MEDLELDPDTMEMPCPCEHCGNWFDLHDGYASEKWYQERNLVICEKCHEEEESEIEDDDYWYDVNIELSNALYGLDKKEGTWDKLEKNNQALIIDIVSKAKRTFTAEQVLAILEDTEHLDDAKMMFVRSEL